MNISQQGKDFIKRKESLVLFAYLDSGGIPTIGYGMTQYLDGSPVRIGDSINEEEADILFDGRIAQDVYSISRSLRLEKMQIKQNQFDALCSIRFNSGKLGRKEYSPNLWQRVINNTIDPRFLQNYLRFDRSGRDVLGSRRLAESDLYFKGKYN